MSFLIQALIMQVAPRIAAMLVPGGAILQAVEAIFKVLMWVIINAARIFTLIESLVATAGQAVAGNTAGVAAGVESGLVQIIVLVIDFLASYLGLGGKLKGVIMKVSGKLKDVLKKVLDAIKKRAKAKAKTKHDQHKPVDKKPDSDKAASPQHPKPDDRDPQKARDDAKDPRNHQRDPDDKDPRNHKPDADDKDPRNRKPDGDDKDPRNHKPDDDRDPKKRKDHDDDRDPKKRKPDTDHDPYRDGKRRHDDDHDGQGKKRTDDERRQDDERNKREDNEARVKAAGREARRALHRGKPEREARHTLDGIARKHRVNVSISSNDRGWQVRFHVNPYWLDFFDREADKELIKKIKDAGYLLSPLNEDARSLSRRLTDRANELQAQGATREDAMRQARDDLFGDASTVEEIRRQMRRSRIALRGSTGDDEGHVFQEAVRHAIRQSLQRRHPGRYLVLRETEEQGGFDVTVIDLRTRRITVIDAKTTFDVFKTQASSKVAGPGAFTLRPGEGNGNMAQRILANRENLDAVAEGRRLVNDDGNVVELRISAIATTSRLEANLKAVERQLDAIRRRIVDNGSNARALHRVDAAIEMVREAGEDQSGVRPLVITRRGTPDASEGDLRAAARLLERVGVQTKDAEHDLPLVASPHDGAGLITGD